MNMELINKIEANISELESKLKKGNDLLVSTIAGIRKFKSDKATITNEMNTINGMVHALKSVVNELKVSNPENTADIHLVQE